MVFDQYANIIAVHQEEFPQYYENPGYGDVISFSLPILISGPIAGIHMMRQRSRKLQTSVLR